MVSLGLEDKHLWCLATTAAAAAAEGLCQWMAEDMRGNVDAVNVEVVGVGVGVVAAAAAVAVAGEEKEEEACFEL